MQVNNGTRVTAWCLISLPCSVEIPLTFESVFHMLIQTKVHACICYLPIQWIVILQNTTYDKHQSHSVSFQLKFPLTFESVFHMLIQKYIHAFVIYLYNVLLSFRTLLMTNIKVIVIVSKSHIFNLQIPNFTTPHLSFATLRSQPHLHGM